MPDDLLEVIAELVMCGMPLGKHETLLYPDMLHGMVASHFSKLEIKVSRELSVAVTSKIFEIVARMKDHA